MDDLFDFDILGYFDDLLNIFLDGDDLGNFHYSFDCLFNDLLDLNDFGGDSEDLKNIINTHYS